MKWKYQNWKKTKIGYIVKILTAIRILHFNLGWKLISKDINNRKTEETGREKDIFDFAFSFFRQNGCTDHAMDNNVENWMAEAVSFHFALMLFWKLFAKF